MPVLVSIGIPTYNQVSFIAQAVESALAQDYPHLEVVVADDCSTDSTRAALLRFNDDPRFRYIRNEKNRGRVGNYRALLYEYTGGDWYLNLDGDDYLTDQSYISKVMKLVQQQEELVLVAAGQDAFDRHGKDKNYEQQFGGQTQVWEGKQAFLNWNRFVFPHLTCCYNRKLALATDFYRAQIISSDWESLLRLILQGKVAYIDEAVGKWRFTGYNSSSQSDVDVLEKNSAFVHGAADYALEKGLLEKKEAEQWRSKMILLNHYSQLTTAIKKKKPGEFFKALKHIMQKKPINLFRVWPLLLNKAMT